jgi:GNAT superfamily N-acetyltransferase
LLSGINPVIIRAYEKTDLEYEINRHRELYAAEYGFGTGFTDYVEKYVRKFDEHHDADKENIWIAEEGGRPVGMIAIVKADEAAAQLRWFLIEPEARGLGLGYMLMNTVMDFCREKGYRHIFLWTVNILGAARKLYGSFGFRLTETKPNDSWGKELVEERWDMDIN